MSEDRCCLCNEDFPHAAPHTAIRMGLLFPLSRMPSRFQVRHRGGAFMCGNCFFDLRDDEEDCEA